MLSEQYGLVLTPLSSRYIRVYEKSIKPSLASAGLKPFLARSSSSLIFTEISEKIRNATLIIADISDPNPNIFYELGITETLGKQIVLLTNSSVPLLFDLTRYRVLKYNTSQQGLKRLEILLSKAIEAILPAKEMKQAPSTDASPPVFNESNSSEIDSLLQ